MALYNLDSGNASAGSKPCAAGFLAVEMCCLLLYGKQDVYTSKTLAASGDELLIPLVTEAAEAESTVGPCCLLYLTRERCDMKF